MADQQVLQRRIVIIGAGIGGICAAIRLSGAGYRDIVVLDRADRIGGTWRDNSYPGSGCDVPSHLYSFSFARNPGWSRKFVEQPEILEYLEHCVDRFRIRPMLRLGTPVTGATFDAGRGVWQIRIESADGAAELEADVLIAATGQLNRPFVPDLAGLDSFTGPVFHSARWQHDTDLVGRDVAVIGNGASAVQFVPRIAPLARSVTVYQRSANWILPKPDRRFSRLERKLFALVPPLEIAYRWSIYLRFETRFSAFLEGSRLTGLLEKVALGHLKSQIVDREVRATQRPDYRAGCKRILISNDYLASLDRPCSTVVTEPIDHVDATGITDTSGVRRPADAVIFATGFRTTEFLSPIDIRGRDGQRLTDAWSEGPKAHFGITVPGFPNLFILYGPNTNLGHNSIIFMLERQVTHVLAALEEADRRRSSTIEVRGPVAAASDDDLQRHAQRTVWLSSCSNWYKDEAGRLTNNWPKNTIRYWRDTRQLGPDDYEFSGGVAGERGSA